MFQIEVTVLTEPCLADVKNRRSSRGAPVLDFTDGSPEDFTAAGPGRSGSRFRLGRWFRPRFQTECPSVLHIKGVFILNHGVENTTSSISTNFLIDVSL